VPDTWTVNDPAKVLAQGDKAAITKVAQALGLSADQFEAAAQGIELFVIGPAENGFSPNINVTPNSLSTMPSAAALASEMQSVGATVGTARTVKTPIGEAIVLPYTLPLGDLAIEGRAIVAETPDGFVSLAVSHPSAKEADALTEQVISSLGAL
jgi:hypothetical protein